MRVLRAKPSNIAKRCQRLRAGDLLILERGTYDRPVIVTGIAGTPQKPIVIEAEKGAVFTSRLTLKKYTARANHIALRRQAAGNYPSVGQTADEAALAFIHCKHVIVEGLQFRRCWPTAVYLDECQHIRLDGLKIREGTIAIGANGMTTRDVTVCHCDWRQDLSDEHRMWNTVPWRAIHGSRNNSGTGVDPDEDYRAWDGDFFRAWDVTGNIVIRDNTISDAFNGIHFFNRIDELAPGVDARALRYNGGRRASANVLIENNTFTRIRDNVIEPEDYAWNWVIRHNVFADCYRPFSLELNRAGWFYIYGNYGWMNNSPSLGEPGLERTKASHFKLGGLQNNEGNIHVFFNSWHYKRGKGIFPKGALRNLRHCNNAIGFGDPCRAQMFGRTAALPQDGRHGSSTYATDDLSQHFTRQWDALHFNITFDGDIAHDADFPEQFRKKGYALGPASRAGAPGFAAPEDEKPDLSLERDAPARAASIVFSIELPDGAIHEIEEGWNVGAYQTAGSYDALDCLFAFLPEDAATRSREAPAPEADDPPADPPQPPDPPDPQQPPDPPQPPEPPAPPEAPHTPADRNKLLLF